VHRIAATPDTHLAPPATDSGVVGDARLTYHEISRRFESGERLVATRAAPDSPEPWPDGTPLFVVTPDGALRVAGDGRDPAIAPGDTVIALAAAEPVGGADAAASRETRV